MGLLFAKHYIEHTTKTIPLNYEDKVYILKADEKVILSDYLEIVYDNGKDIVLGHGNGERIVFSLSGGILRFTVIEDEKNTGKITIRYPWVDGYSGIHILRLSEREYTDFTIMDRYIDYKD
jgi:hypothetical protein